MGKAVIDLPDPLEAHPDEPLPAAGGGGIDDLLAKMAGEEIDRLLADAEPHGEPPRTASERKLIQPAASKPVEVPAAPTPSHEPSPEGAGGVDLELATSVAERSALDAPPDPTDGLQKIDAAVFDEAVADVQTEDAPLPAYLKPLEWLNAPLGFLPESARELVGKVALLTFFNALAVLIYVLVFRKHH